MKAAPTDRWCARRKGVTVVYDFYDLRAWFADTNKSSDLTNILQLAVGRKHADAYGWTWERIA